MPRLYTPVKRLSIVRVLLFDKHSITGATEYDRIICD